MSKLICIIGTDGSGKTTLADSFVEALVAKGEKAERLWLGAESILMAPARRLLKLAWKGRGKSKITGHDDRKSKTTTSTRDYQAEIRNKNALVSRYPWAVKLYLALVWTDYRMQVAVKRWRARANTTIVADRYLFDVAVNLGLTLGWSPDQVVAFARSRLAKMQLPDVRVFLRVSPEISLSRKDDIPDIAYLRLRFSYYEAIAKAFGFVERDGTLPISNNRDWLIVETARTARIPYVMYVHANNSDIGGADKVMALMAAHMRDYGRPEGGARVAVCLRLQTAITDSYYASSVPVIHHPFVRPQTSKGVVGLLKLLVAAPASLWFFWRLFGREDPDIVHVNDLYDILPAIAASWRKIPVVWHIRMIKTSNKMRRFFAGAVRRYSVVSISVSEAVRAHYFPQSAVGHDARVVYDLGNAHLISDDRDPEQPVARPVGLPTHGRLVAMVGRIEPWKGQEVFVRAVSLLPAKLRAAHVFALIGGGVEAKEDYLAKVTAAANAVGILMLGQRDDVPTLMRAADISVHASILPDPFPGVVIESLLSGAATVAANAGGAVEMIRTTQQGLLYTPGQAQELANILKELLDNPVAPRQRFGAQGRARGLALVNSDVVDAEISRIYLSLGRKGP